MRPATLDQHRAKFERLFDRSFDVWNRHADAWMDCHVHGKAGRKAKRRALKNVHRVISDMKRVERAIHRLENASAS